VNRSAARAEYWIRRGGRGDAKNNQHPPSPPVSGQSIKTENGGRGKNISEIIPVLSGGVFSSQLRPSIIVVYVRRSNTYHYMRYIILAHIRPVVGDSYSADRCHRGPVRREKPLLPLLASRALFTPSSASSYYIIILCTIRTFLYRVNRPAGRRRSGDTRGRPSV